MVIVYQWYRPGDENLALPSEKQSMFNVIILRMRGNSRFQLHEQWKISDAHFLWFKYFLLWPLVIAEIAGLWCGTVPVADPAMGGPGAPPHWPNLRASVAYTLLSFGGGTPATWGVEFERRRCRDAEGVEGEGSRKRFWGIPCAILCDFAHFRALWKLPENGRFLFFTGL